MIDLDLATEEEMVAAFLRAEVDSPRYVDLIDCELSEAGCTRKLIDEPNLFDPTENALRKQLLNFRGYQARELLFEGFPRDASWRRVILQAADFETMRYANFETWVHLSDGTRLVSVGARNLVERPDERDTCHIQEIVEALRNGRRFPELIAAQHDDGSLVLIEGHSRATAYMLSDFRKDVEALVASSQSMSEWAFY